MNVGYNERCGPGVLNGPLSCESDHWDSKTKSTTKLGQKKPYKIFYVIFSPYLQIVLVVLSNRDNHYA